VVYSTYKLSTLGNKSKFLSFFSAADAPGNDTCTCFYGIFFILKGNKICMEEHIIIKIISKSQNQIGSTNKQVLFFNAFKV
jgi:hypothetical protein